ncbi:oligoribonuclease [Candidatus Saccharibacteria bacterium]|nr:oligoribonuclease [Candidatus Saccharibacteria bacterium]
MGKKAKLLWVDLEMTGLDPQKDRILEVACIATDWDFNEIARMTSVVKVPKRIIKKRMVGEFWEKNIESYNSLISQNETGKTTEEVEEEVLDFVEKNFGKEVILAGNSIHQDRRFIRNEWKRLDERLHYRMFDVSAWKVYFENAMDIKFTKRDAHRALDDIEGSIEEIKYYLKRVRGSKFEKGR